MSVRLQLRHLGGSLAGVAALAALGLWLHEGGEELVAPPEPEREARPARADEGRHDERSWDALRSQVGPRIALVRSRYRIASARGGASLGGAAYGSGVLVQPTLVLTSSHLVRPWRDALGRPADEVAVRPRWTGTLDSLSVQLPDQEPVPATLFAIAGGADLALLQIPRRPTIPPRLADRATPLQVGEEVAVLSHQAAGPLPALALIATAATGAEPAAAARPFFLTARVARIERDARRSAIQVGLDRAASTSGGGGAVVDRQGALVGLTRGRFEPAGEARIAGCAVTTNRYGAGTVEVVPGEQIADFLARVGAIADPRRDLVDGRP